MKRLLAAIGLAALVAVPASAAWLTLAEAQKVDAIRVGERSVTSEAFGAEWRVQDARGNTATVMTPFHRLALAARNAAFKKQPLKPGEPDRILRQDASRLVVWVTLRGTSEDFARRYAPLLYLGERPIKPSFVQNEHTAARQEDGWIARCVYGFPNGELTTASRVVLTVADADDREVARFTIDLTGMR